MWRAGLLERSRGEETTAHPAGDSRIATKPVLNLQLYSHFCRQSTIFQRQLKAS